MKVNVKVIPRSSKSEIVGETVPGVIKVKLKSPPVDGEANKELIKLIAKEYKVKKSQVSIVKGETSKNKTIEIKE